MNKESIVKEKINSHLVEQTFDTIQEKIDYLENRTYDGKDLGATYTQEQTTFKVWAPLAEKVTVNFYHSGDIRETALENQFDLIQEHHVWSIQIPGDLKGLFYTYTITTDGKANETNDLYATAVGVNGDRAAIIDLRDTDPEGWSADQHVLQPRMTDAYIWEVHIADFSSDPNAGFRKEHRGKYLAFTETDTSYKNEGNTATGLAHLKQLGVNMVHILPAFDFDNDEEGTAYNWGYDPKNYNVPEGRYASDPRHPETRIKEFKQMVQSLHQNGISVVLDVVYNHTSQTEEAWFNLTVPDYYYRQDASGAFADGSACGNETASERKMMRQYMVDSVLYWAKEYHIDGFRFDLMGLHDVETMNAIRKALNDEGLSEVILYGEPWDAGSNEIHWPNLPANTENVKELKEGIAVFNADFRDAVKGSVFESEHGGFVQGANDENGLSDIDLILSLKANIDTWANTPNQTIAYVSAHDNLSLYDKLTSSLLPDVSQETYQRHETVIQANKLAAVLLFTGQGAVFMQAGEEFGRSKYGDENSYQSPIEINQIDWRLVETNQDLLRYYEGLYQIRQHYVPLRDSETDTAQKMSFSHDPIENLVAYTISNPEPTQNSWKQLAVVLNATDKPQDITLQGTDLPEKWTIIADNDTAGLSPLGEITGNELTIAAKSAWILTA